MPRSLLVWWVILWMVSASVGHAAQTEYREKEGEREDAAPSENTLADSAMRVAGDRVASLVQWVDSFFEDPEYTEEEADARISLRQSIEYGQTTGTEYRSRVRASLTLPNLSRRMKVVLEGDDEDELEGVDRTTLRSAAGESVETSRLGVQYGLLDRARYNYKLTGGVRLGDTALYVGPRFRYYAELSPRLATRFAQRIRWYTRGGWRSDTDLNFSRRVGERNLFRQSFSIDWRETHYKSQGYRFTFTTAFTQPLSKEQALRYTWVSTRLTRPSQRWKSTALSVSYRRAVWREWLLMELTPFLSWHEEDDWKTDFGGTVSVSLVVEGEKITPRPKMEDF